MNIKKMKSLGNGKLYHISDILNKENISYRIGTDSLNSRFHSIYIISLVGIYPDKRGAFVFYHKEKIPKIKNIHERLWKEVEISVNFALHLKNRYSIIVDGIDFDLNNNPYNQSARLVSSAISFANTQGFSGFCKPDELYGISCSNHIINCGHISKL